MTRALGATVALLAACGRDVQLGVAPDAARDAAPDAPGGPFVAGAYSLAFLDPSQQTCMGTLAGNEASFAGITRASLGLVDGSVTLATPNATTLTVTGTPIAMAFAQPSIDVVPNAQNPPGLWDGLVSGDFTAGPLATMRSATDLAVQSTTATSPTGIQGELAVLYATVTAGGQCSVVFGALFTQP